MSRRQAAATGTRRASVPSLVREHARALRECIGQLRSTPAASAIAMAVMAIAIGLPVVLYVLIDNHRTLVTHWQSEPTLTVFLTKTVTPEAMGTLRRRITADADVNRLELLPAAEAFAEFSSSVGFPEQMRTAGNPLPDIFIVTLSSSAWTRDRGKELVKRLGVEPAVDTVVADFAWVERLAAIGALAERGVWVLAILLAAGLLFVVGNSVRSLVEQQREEIEVLMLVGATNDYIRRPFLYGGALHGLGAAVLALIVVEAACSALDGPVGRVAAAYASSFELRHLAWPQALQIAALSALLGWCGAWLGSSHSLRRLQPRTG